VGSVNSHNRSVLLLLPSCFDFHPARWIFRAR